MTTSRTPLSSLATYAKKAGLDLTSVSLGSQVNPTGFGPFDPYFIYPDPSIVRIPRLSVTGDTFIATTPDGHVLEDMSLAGWSRRAASGGQTFFDNAAKRPARRFEGRTAILGGQRNYYHWLMNWLSRVFILETAGMIDQIDTFIVNENLAPYQTEVLGLIPSMADKKIVCIEPDSLVDLKDTLCASIFSNPIHSPALIEWLRHLLGNEKSPVNAERIYISRRDAPKGRRHISNEQDLARLLTSEGFQEVVLSDYTVKQQATIFAQASEIISPHGAGLVNSIFITPGARICEIQSAKHYTRVFWSLGSIAKAQSYNLVRCDSIDSGPAYLQDLVVDLRAVKDLLKKWGNR